MADVRKLPNSLEDAELAIGIVARPAKRKPKKWLLLVLFLLVPTCVIISAALIFLGSGRYVKTDNVYVKSDRINISAQVAGMVTNVLVVDNQVVQAGDSLFQIDNRSYLIQLNASRARLAQVSINLEAQKLELAQARAEIDLQQTNIDFSQGRLRRQQELLINNLGTTENLDNAQHAVNTAQKQLSLATQKSARILALLNGQADITKGDYPLYQSALAAVNEAMLNLDHTTVKAPLAGVVNFTPEVGNYVFPGKPVMALISQAQTWLEANYKETKLTHIRPGQSVLVTIDAYPDQQWQGHVESISRATGAEFALLPPQNATGNWIKIAQRIPVKIVLDKQYNGPPLSMGMSASVAIDTENVRHWQDLMPVF